MRKMIGGCNLQRSCATSCGKCSSYNCFTFTSLIFVRLGAHRRLGEVGTEQDFSVQRIVKHPYYKRPYGLAHDIALLKLDSPAQLTKHVGLVCMPEESYALPIDDDSNKCWITGAELLACKTKSVARQR